MKREIIIVSLLILTTVYFSSCSKDDERVNKTTKINKIDKQIIQNQDEILKFLDQSDFANQIVSINEMNNEDLLSFQANNNYQSYGLYCDELYSELAKDSLNPNLVIENVNSNSDYLELIPDDNESSYMTLSAKFGDNPLYYIMNMDRMYIVGDMVYKVFQEGLLETGITNIDILKGIEVYKDGEDIASIISIGAGASVGNGNNGNNGNNGTGNGHNAGMFKEKIKTDDRDRTMASILIYKFATSPATQYASSYLTRPYKRTLGIWWYCKRHITINSRLAVDIHKNGGQYERKKFPYPTRTEFAYSIKELEVFFVPPPNILECVHYAGYDVYGETPSAPAVTFSKYTNNL